jgi:hypothetical protein
MLETSHPYRGDCELVNGARSDLHCPPVWEGIPVRLGPTGAALRILSNPWVWQRHVLPCPGDRIGVSPAGRYQVRVDGFCEPTAFQ